MAIKQYKWRTTFDYQNERSPVNQLSYGVTPNTQDSWQTVDSGGSESGTWTYWYRDSNTSYGGYYVDSLSSRVAINVTQTWTTSIDNRNYLTVSISTVVNSIVRDDIQGSDQNTPGRNISLYKEPNGTALISVTDNQIATAHTISGSVDMGTYTFTLAPGENLTRNTLFIHNQVVGGQSFDDIWAGIQFMNPLPAETIPHAILNGSNKWVSHNRTGGDLRIWNGSRWTDNLANTDGGTGFGDIPATYKSNKWYNSRTFGLE